MESQKLTVFQRLGNVFRESKPQIKPNNSYNFDTRELLKTQDKQEYDLEKLQKQQSLYLHQQWLKVDSELYQQAIFYETTRIAAYTDFESMEFYPELSAALDIMMEESCQTNSKGKILNIYSESERVKKELETLFYKNLNVHTSLPMWTRNTPIREDSIIPLLNGEEITIKELSDRLKNPNSDEIWTYSIQDGTNAVVPGKIIWCDLTRKNSQLIRVILDDETYIDTTPDHEYMLRDGSFLRADKLTKGQSLMPFYTKISKEKDNKIKGYEKIFNPYSGRYRFTHRIVANECITDYKYENESKVKFLTHHKNHNKLDNSPQNLERLSFAEHVILHEKTSKHLEYYRNREDVVKKRMDGIDRYLRSDERKNRLSIEMGGKYPKYFKDYNHSKLHTEHNEIRSKKMLSKWESDDYRDKCKNRMRITIDENCLEYIKNIIINSDKYIGINELSKLLRVDENFLNLFKKNYTINRDPQKSINTKTINRAIFRKTNQNYFDFVLSIKPTLILDKKYIKSKAIFIGKTTKKVINHKILSIIKLDETSDVYCMEVVGVNGETDRHNFPVCSKNLKGKHTRNGVFLSNCKYGDNMVFLSIDEKEGVVGAKQLPNIEIERWEGDLYSAIKQRTPSEDPKPQEVKFIWKSKDYEFKTWQIAHFRLLTDDRRLPYGVSMLEKARRIYKQLMLAEDAMLIYRVTRAPERRVFKVYVGNLEDKDIEPYVNQVANKFKRTPLIDSKTGQMDLRYNQMPVWKDSPIPLLDGRIITIEELSNEWKSGKENFVYSVQDNTHDIVSGRVVWCDKNYTAESMIKVWLDDDTYVVTAPEHPFILRNGEKKRADELNPNDSLMSYYGDHKVKYTEKIEGDDVYCMTVVGLNGEDDRHNFATLSFNSDGNISQSGVFVSNSQDQDYFIPVRDINAPNPIDTLPGAQNLSEIQDIEYLQKKMFTSIRVPKTFLGFEEAVGEGKNLALQDIRFARTINRIQQAMLQELNKIAIIHLFVLGLEDELENFTLTLNNPSTQAEMLKVEHLQQKITLYKDCVADAGNGFSPMSMTRAKKEILDMSDDEIRLDLEQQRIEKAAAAELANTSEVITRTGIFNKVDKLYGNIGAKSTGQGAQMSQEPGSGGPSLSTSGGMEIPPPNEMGGTKTSPETNPNEMGQTETPPQPGITPEGIEEKDKLLVEYRNLLNEKVNKYREIYFNKLLDSYEPKETTTSKLEDKIIENEHKVSGEINEMLKNIDKLMNE